MTWDAIWNFLKPFLTVGVAVSITLAILKLVAPKWVESLFNLQLEKRKHIQQREIEELRHTIQRMFSRISKVHEKEFEVLPKAWFMLHDAQGSAFNLVGRFRTYPSFEGMPDEQLEEFMERSPLTPFQRKELKAASDRTKYYQKAIQGIELDQAKEKQRLFNNYVIEHRIFMTEGLRTKFTAISGLLFEGLVAYDYGKYGNDYKLAEEGRVKITETQNQIAAIEKAVQDRLHFDEA